MVPMRARRRMRALHEPACSAGFPACGFTGLSSPLDQERATGKSPEPAGSKACATNPPRFMVPMRATYGVGATHEPTHPRPLPGGEQAYVHALSVPLRGGVRGGFKAPMRAKKSVAATHE